MCFLGSGDRHIALEPQDGPSRGSVEAGRVGEGSRTVVRRCSFTVARVSLLT